MRIVSRIRALFRLMRIEYDKFIDEFVKDPES
jgi:hypothetical protein